MQACRKDTQLLIESLAVAITSALLGLMICRPVAAALVALIATTDPLRLELPVNSSLLLFVTTISVAAALICGFVPAVRATAGEVLPSLQQGSRTTSPSRAQRAVGRVVSAVQLTLSLVLIAAAFLFALSLHKLVTFDIGVARRNLVVADVDAIDAGYKSADLEAVKERIRERLSAIPTVESATFSENGIYTYRSMETIVEVNGFTSSNPREPSTRLDQVGPHFLHTLGTPILAGRDFEDRDQAAGSRLAVINQQFARHFFPGKNPLGQNIYIHLEKGKATYQVIGIAKDMPRQIREAPSSTVYLSGSGYDGSMPSTRFLVRTRVNPDRVMPDLRAAIRAEDPDLRIVDLNSADELLNRTIDTDRLIASLSFGFGILALTLAGVGIYGLIAYDVTRRTGEIGIRMALGATRGGVFALIFREVALVLTAGIAMGTAAALAMSRLVAGMVFELKPQDPRVLGAAALVLAAAAMGAAWFPAHRAASLDPMAALRHE